MNVHQLKDLPPHELHTALEGECFRVEEQNYMKPLTEQELADFRAQFSQTSIDIDALKEELDQVKAKIKEKLNPLSEKNRVALSAIRHRGVFTKGKVYLMPDHENRVMHIVSSEGIVIDSRMMKPEERQYTISHNQKSA